MKRVLLFLFVLFSVQSFAQGSAILRGFKKLFHAPKKPVRVYVPKSTPRSNPKVINPLLDLADNYYSVYGGYRPNRSHVGKKMKELVKELEASLKKARKDSEFNEIFGKATPSAKEKELYLENKIVLEEVSKQFGRKFGGGTTLVDERIYKIIANYQERRGISALKFGSNNKVKYKISQEAYDSFLLEKESINAQLRIYKSVCEILDSPNNLSFLEDHFLRAWNRLSLRRGVTRHVDGEIEYLTRQLSRETNTKLKKRWQQELVYFQQRKADITRSKNLLVKSHPELARDVGNLRFDRINQVVENETQKLINQINDIETNLSKLGYIKESNVNVALTSKTDLINELNFLKLRLENATKQFRLDFPQSSNTRSYGELNKIVKEKIDENETGLRRIIHNSSDISGMNIESYLLIHSDLGTSRVFTKKIRERIAKDLSEKNYYVKVDKKYKKFKEENVEIKIASEPTKNKSLIKLDSEANLYIENTENLGSEISRLNSSLSKEFDQSQLKVLMFSNHRTKGDLKKKANIVIDSIRKIFPRKAVTFLLNKKDNLLKRTINREFMQNKGKTIFLVGHVEKGAFVNKVNSNYRIPLSEIDELARKHGNNYFIAGCSSSYYGVPGTTDLINDLNFGVALSRSYSEASSFKTFMTKLSNEKMNGGLGDVKLVLTADSFSNDGFKKVEVFTKVKGYWKKLVDLFIGYFS